MTEEANEHAQQAEGNPSKAPSPVPPEFDPDLELMDMSLRHQWPDAREERRSDEK